LEEVLSHIKISPESSAANLHLRRVNSHSLVNGLGSLQTLAFHRSRALAAIFPMSKQQMPVTKCFTSSNTHIREELCKRQCREQSDEISGEGMARKQKARPEKPDGPLRSQRD
jgi:hypothetical protein